MRVVVQTPELLMCRRVQIVSFACSLLLLLVAAGRSEAGDQKAVVEKIKAHYQAAVAAYDDGDFDKTKVQLQQAIALSKENGVGNNKIVAQTYLLFGVLEIAGFKDPDAGVRYFAKALDISPAIQLPPSMASKAVLAAFERAENQSSPGDASGGSKEPSAPSVVEVEKEKPAPSAPEKKRADAEGKERDKRTRDDRVRDDKLVDDLAKAKIGESQAEADKSRVQKDTQDKDRQITEMKGRLSQLEKEKQEQDKQLTDAKTRLQQLEKDKPDKDKQLGEAKGRASQLEKEKQEQDKQLAASKDSARKENEANDKVKKDKLESDRQAADAKARLLQLTKEKQETDQQLATARADGKREHEANDKLEKAKAESDRQLGDTKGRLQQLTKEKQETDRQLATTRDGEKRERESREKLEKVWQEAQARDKDRKNRDEQARLEHDKLVDGPDLPGHFSEPIYCTLPDEIPPGADLYVHCVPHANVAAKVVALYYRAGGTVVYNATTMERSRKGWYTALIPGTRITGKLLHYYVEARDARQDVTATYGKATSPNIAMIKPAGGRAH
jgi:hypothetical protein